MKIRQFLRDVVVSMNEDLRMRGKLSSEKPVRALSYSGIGMHGESCWGITADLLDVMAEIIPCFYCLDGEEQDTLHVALHEMIKGACSDSTGTEIITYFPYVAVIKGDFPEED